MRAVRAFALLVTGEAEVLEAVHGWRCDGVVDVVYLLMIGVDADETWRRFEACIDG